jgi:hypothetical protein
LKCCQGRRTVAIDKRALFPVEYLAEAKRGDYDIGYGYGMQPEYGGQ